MRFTYNTNVPPRFHPPRLSAIMTMLTLPFLLSSYRNLSLLYRLPSSSSDQRNYCNKFNTRLAFEYGRTRWYVRYLLCDFALMRGITSLPRKEKLPRMMQQKTSRPFSLVGRLEEEETEHKQPTWG